MKGVSEACIATIFTVQYLLLFKYTSSDSPKFEWGSCICLYTLHVRVMSCALRDMHRYLAQAHRLSHGTFYDIY